MQKLNNYKFSDNEWNNFFFSSHIANAKHGIKEKTESIQNDFRKNITLDNGKTKNICLIDKDNVHNNTLQVINQYRADAEEPAARRGRYDVTVLVNGLPLVHIELKRRGVHIKEAFNQINRYNEESFWSGSGLYEYVQIFVISNGTFTKYYSNTTRNRHITEKAARKSCSPKTSNSYEFTSWWADAKNKQIPDLIDFAKTFFAKHSLLNLLTKYCDFTENKTLLAMRP
jgi:type I restriction enzyme R subunit